MIPNTTSSRTEWDLEDWFGSSEAVIHQISVMIYVVLGLDVVNRLPVEWGWDFED